MGNCGVNIRELEDPSAIKGKIKYKKGMRTKISPFWSKKGDPKHEEEKRRREEEKERYGFMTLSMDAMMLYGN